MPEHDDTEPNMFERMLPRIGPLEAVRRHKILFALPILLLVGLAVAYSVQREPIYTAEARQTIGRVDVSAPGALAGFQSATRALASSYSRAIVAPAVVNPVAKAVGTSPAEIRDRLSATPIPESSVIAIKATGSSKRQAIAIASLGAKSLEAYVARLNRSNPNADRLFREFKRAALRQSELRDELAQLRRSIGANPDAAERERINRLEGRVQSAELTVAVSRENYAVSRRSESNVSILQTISLPQSATNDSSSSGQLALFIGLGAGVLVGIALASLRANRQVRRALSMD